MKIRLFLRVGVIGLILYSILISSCSESDKTVSTVTLEEEGTGEVYFVKYDGGDTVLRYTHNLGSSPKDVFFVFTNAGSSNSNSTISVIGNQTTNQSPQTSTFSKDFPIGQASGFSVEAKTRLRDRPELIQLDLPLITLGEESGQRVSQLIQTDRQSATLGSSQSFLDWDFNRNTQVSVTATLRKIIDVSTDVVLNLWVADNAWDSCSKKFCMTSDKLNAFGEKFLKSGSDNDIYEWVTNIFGAPWGTHSNSAYISASAAGEIDILFYDIDADNSDDGGVLGFFWPKDNAIRDSSDTTNYTNISNERLMFYIDSVMAANPQDILDQSGAGDSTWDITDEMPAEMVATLAHEFQHMIHFYQKTMIRAGSSSETWLNEMCSLVTEDLVADKIMANGPRGTAYDTYSAGSSGNSSGRLPWFNSINYYGLIDWYSGSAVYYSYATSYAFGAYIARNYGGAGLFQKIIQNSYTDETAVTRALSDMGHDLSFADLLKRWGVAVLLSGDTTASSGYQYNSGNSFVSTLDSVTYELGSINLYYYSPLPAITESSSFAVSSMYKTSNRYFKVGSEMTNSGTWTISMPSGVKLTVVTRDSD
ncbi:hypothetical protein KJ966_08960 [bacterium]|nr:hypothetical protein [bacterium]